MTLSLIPAVAVTGPTHIIRPVATTVLGTLAGAAAVTILAVGAHYLRPSAAAPIAVVMPMPVPVPMPAPAPAAAIATVPTPTAPDHRAGLEDVSFVFSVNDVTYMKLADADAEAFPAHGPIRAISDDDGMTLDSVAEVAATDLPLEHRRWFNRRVVVEGGCEATVTGFALVGRLVGEAEYATTPAIDEVTGRSYWTTVGGLEQGSPVIAARLSGCAGIYARDAELAPVLSAIEVDDDALAASARAQFADSALAKTAQQQWTEAGGQGSWLDDPSDVSIQIVRHPTTDVTWVSVHGTYSEGCGGPEINTWALYRADSAGNLSLAKARELGDLQTIDRLVDLDGDGTFELIGTSWLGLDQIVSTAAGLELERLSRPFYGCPC